MKNISCGQGEFYILPMTKFSKFKFKTQYLMLYGSETWPVTEIGKTS